MGVNIWMTQCDRAARAFARRFADETRGNVALTFAIALPVLVILTMGGVDISRASTVRANLQDALDAATLAAARSSANTNDGLTTVGKAALAANLQAYPDISLTNVSFTINADQVVIADATVDVKTLVANIVLPPYGKILGDKTPVAAHSEVNRSSKNLEVSLVLDITGSMSDGKIDQLKDAANQLVDIVVKDQQTPFYSKVAIVPYSMGVNVGTYANTARGTPTQSTNISNILWSTTLLPKTINAATRASTITVTTSTAHGFANGNKVTIWNSAGMDDLNGKVFTVANATLTTFQLSGIDSRSYDKFTGTASVARCLRADCYPVVTSTGHGLSNNDYVYLTDVGGMTQLNGQPFQVQDVVAGVSYVLKTVGSNFYTSGGKSWCGQYGCEWRVFPNSTGTLRAFQESTCVSERTGSAAYTDAYTSTSSTRVGFTYPSAATRSTTNNGCPPNVLLPLSSNKTTIKSSISGLEIGGSTAGQIGTAWGWYTVAPTFNSLWPSSAAGAYGDDDILKAVILMTDGAFNTPYCSGVIAGDAGTGSGSAADKITCGATNGDAFAQADKLCTAMKAKGVIVYTVGFQVDDDDAGDFLAKCATSASYAYLPESGEDLTEAFAAIGRDITRLRISR